MASNTLFKGCVQIIASCERHKATEWQWRKWKGKNRVGTYFNTFRGQYDESVNIQIVYTATI